MAEGVNADTPPWTFIYFRLAKLCIVRWLHDLTYTEPNVIGTYDPMDVRALGTRYLWHCFAK